MIKRLSQKKGVQQYWHSVVANIVKSNVADNGPRVFFSHLSKLSKWIVKHLLKQNQHEIHIVIEESFTSVSSR